MLDLTKVQGNVSSKNKVILDLSSGAYDANVSGLYQDEYLALRNALQTYFKETFSSDPYELGTVDFNSSLTPASLQPTHFYLSTGGFEGSPDGLGTLYIFIRTNSSGSSTTKSTSRDFPLLSSPKTSMSSLEGIQQHCSFPAESYFRT